jgi:hypothetical protein
MTQKPFLTTLLAALLIFAACKKEKNSPDDYIVRDGNKAMGLYLNGLPWIANYRDAGSGITPLSISMFWNPVLRYNYMWIRGLKANEEISIYLPPPLTVGRKSLSTTTFPWPSVRPNGAYGMYEIYSPYDQYMTNDTVVGYVDILSCDTMRSQIEARFEYESINKQTNRRIRVTNGYFKLN